MKNQYLGDVDEFGKYGSLSKILQTNFKLGTNWI